MEPVLGWDIQRAYTAAELADVSGNKNIPILGLEVIDGRTGNKFRFMKATTAWNGNDCIVHDFAGANEPSDGAPCSALNQPFAGVAVTTIAVNGGGWVQRHGVFNGQDGLGANITTATTAGQLIASTATSGRGAGQEPSAGANPTQVEARAVAAALQGVRITALDNGSSNRAQVLLFG